MTENKLTDKQLKFCQEYVFDWNRTQAAIRAGYSEKTAYSTGSENMKKPEVLAEIERQKQNIEELAGVSKLMGVKVLMEIVDNSDEEMNKRAAVQDLSKMLGWNNPDKTLNINVNKEVVPLSPKEAKEINDQLDKEY